MFSCFVITLSTVTLNLTPLERAAPRQPSSMKPLLLGSPDDDEPEKKLLSTYRSHSLHSTHSLTFARFSYRFFYKSKKS